MCLYHDRRDKNSLKGLTFVGKEADIDEENFSEFPSVLGRQLHEYKINPSNKRVENIPIIDLDWPFPNKYYKSIGFAINGFDFCFKNLLVALTNILDPSPNLINTETNTEQIDNTLTLESFANKKNIEDKISEYNAIRTKNFINESFLLYDKSNLIKKTFVTAINKQLSLYGSFSYFSGKTSIKDLKLINSPLIFLIEKRSLKENLKIQLAYINGSDVKTEDKKIHDFSITKLGKRQKSMLSLPIETIIVRAQQDFDIVGGLNPIQIQITNDTVLNLLQKYKNFAYKVTPLGLLFPASITNNTTHIFITANNISGVKKGILYYKIYNILADIDLNKISKWDEIKAKSIWTNVQFKDHKEINNNNHLCSPFITRTFSNLTSFTILLQDDQNKKIEFNNGEKKISILNFQIDVYLT